MPAERLSPLDTAFLELEEADDCSHMHVGWAMVFDRPPDGVPNTRAVRRIISERLSALPRFASRLSAPRAGRLSWPTWEDDPLFDLGAHVRHATLPAPGGDDELLEWLGDFYSHRLDRARPLWELTLLDGLLDGCWALAAKVHHCLIDGVSGVEVTALLLDSSPQGGPALATPPHVADDGLGPPDLLSMVARGARAGVGVMLHPTRLLEMVERSRALAEIVREELVPAAQTSLNVPIGGARRLALVETELGELKRIKRALGGTVNDVILAAAAGGLRDLLVARGEHPPERGLRAMVPVNVRRAGELVTLGNRVSSLFVELPVAESDPVERYRRTADATEALKSGRQAAGAETLIDLAGYAPPVIHALVARMSFAPRLFNLTITNVPGSQTTLYAFGAPLRGIVPIVPIFANHAVGIAAISYDGRVAFGLNGDLSSMGDLDTLAEGIRHSLKELGSIARRRERAVARSGPTSRGTWPAVPAG